jgi:hypothetical protein
VACSIIVIQFSEKEEWNLALIGICIDTDVPTQKYNVWLPPYETWDSIALIEIWNAMKYKGNIIYSGMNDIHQFSFDEGMYLP